MANITKLAAAGDSLTDVAGQSGTKHWFDLGRTVYSDYMTQYYGPFSLGYNAARAGATAQIIAGQNGASTTTSWRVPPSYGDQILQNFLGLFDAGIGAALRDGYSNSAVIWIGQNDFTPNQGNAFTNIYNSVWNDGQVTDYVTDVHDAIMDGADDYLTYGDGQLVVCTPVSYNFSPFVRASYTDATKRERVEQAIGVELRNMIKDSCRSRGLVCLDMHQLYDDLLGDHANPTTSFSFGGNTIDADEGGLTNFYAFQDDDVHPSTTVAAIHLVAIMTAFKIGYSHSFTEPSESTMCGWCSGLATGGANTLNLYYPKYVSAYNLSTTGRVATGQIFAPGVAAGQVFQPGVVAGQAA